MKKSTFHVTEGSKTTMFKLNNEIQIPEIGLGVYKMEAGKEMNDAVKYAYQSGYRLYDTVQMYKNEQRLQQNIDVFDFEISKEDMEELNHMNENHRTSFDPLTFDF